MGDALDFLQNRGLLPSDPDEVASRVRSALTNAARTVAQYAFGGAVSVVATTLNLAVTLVGVVFVGAYLLIDVRRIEAACFGLRPTATATTRRASGTPSGTRSPSTWAGSR